MTTTPRPIGYWLKRLDRSIEDGFERDLAAWTLTRRHWQVLNTLQLGPADEDRIAQALRPFWAEGAITQQEVVDDLLDRGWAASADGRVALTQAGIAAHAQILTQVNATRARVLNGLTGEDYETVLRVLEQMTANVEATT